MPNISEVEDKKAYCTFDDGEAIVISWWAI